MKRMTIIAILPVFILGLLITDGHASAAEIKQRMIDRLPVIKALKDKGIVGENNQGYLEFIGQSFLRRKYSGSQGNWKKKIYQERRICSGSPCRRKFSITEGWGTFSIPSLRSIVES